MEGGRPPAISNLAETRPRLPATRDVTRQARKDVTDSATAGSTATRTFPGTSPHIQEIFTNPYLRVNASQKFRFMRGFEELEDQEPCQMRDAADRLPRVMSGPQLGLRPLRAPSPL